MDFGVVEIDLAFECTLIVGLTQPARHSLSCRRVVKQIVTSLYCRIPMAGVVS
jgi:hypothetical protein